MLRTSQSLNPSAIKTGLIKEDGLKDKKKTTTFLKIDSEESRKALDTSKLVAK